MHTPTPDAADAANTIRRIAERLGLDPIETAQTIAAVLRYLTARGLIRARRRPRYLAPGARKRRRTRA